MAKITTTDRSLLLKIAMAPITRDDMAQTPANSPGMPSQRLLVIVSPPRCPEAAIIINIAKDKKKPTISPIDHFPGVVLGPIIYLPALSIKPEVVRDTAYSYLFK